MERMLKSERVRLAQSILQQLHTGRVTRGVKADIVTLLKQERLTAQWAADEADRAVSPTRIEQRLGTVRLSTHNISHLEKALAATTAADIIREIVSLHYLTHRRGNPTKGSLRIPLSARPPAGVALLQEINTRLHQLESAVTALESSLASWGCPPAISGNLEDAGRSTERLDRVHHQLKETRHLPGASNTPEEYEG